MNIVILGPGAIGTLWAHQLHRAGHRLSFWARSPQTPLLRQLDDEPMLAFSNQDHHALQAADLLLITVKAWQVQDALAPIAASLAPQTIIMLMHNGMGTAEQVARTLPNNPIVLATTTHGALFTEPQRVKHTGHGLTQMGGYNQDGAKCAFLADVFDHAMGPVEWHEDVNQVLWHKLAVNCAINPMTAHHNIRNGELAQPHYQATLYALYHELSLVMNAEGVTTSAQDVQQRVERVYHATAGNYSSMHQDLHHQRPSEIDYITGYLIRKAKLHGIAVPSNQALYDAIIARHNAA